VGPGGDVEDCLQMTFVEAIGAFPRYRGDASVRTWLARIAVHVVHQEWRRPARRRNVSLELLPADEEPEAPEAALDHRVHQRRLAARVYEHLEAIAPARRIPFILHVLEGLSIEEVAALVGASRVATKSRIFWARRTLLRRVEGDPVLAGALGGDR
jgi:RNA polymerase sigma-70 factor (ECF subfamily)